MANDKKFIVKNGLQSQENVVIGSTVDNGTDKLQVTGSAKIIGKVDVAQSTNATPTAKFTNSGGPSSIVAEFAGASQSIRIVNDTAGDYSILNTGQDNGIKLYNDTDGTEILYNGTVDLDFNSDGIDFKREPTYLGSVFWNAGNDGAGSGLDADVLDGIDSLQFVRSDEDDTLDGNYIITGNLTVQGTRTEISSETVLIADNIITLNSNYTGSTPTENGGIEVERGTLANATFQWLEGSDQWEMAGPSTGLVLGDSSNLQGSITSYANSFILSAGGASGVSNGTVFLSGKLNGTSANAGVASFYNQGTGISYGELLYGGVPKLRTEAAGTVTAGNARVQGSITVGTNSGGAYIYMDGAGNNGTIYSSAGEIGFLNTTFNYALKVDAAGDVVVTDDIYAQKFIDINDNTYEVIPSGASSLNNIDLEGALRHNGETNTLINFPASDQVGFTLGGVQQGLMTTASFQYTGDVIADKFVDRNDNAFFLNPAGLSELHSANFYSGDATNDLNVGRNINERFNINVTDGQAYLRYYQDETDATNHSVNFEIQSTGNGIHKFNFNKEINAGGNNISAGNGVFSGTAYADVFADYSDPTYFADFNNTGNSINMAGTIEGGNGTAALPTYTFGSDVNTGMYRGAADRLNFSAGGNNELQVYTTYVNASGSFRAPIFYDTDDTAYYTNPKGTSVMNRIELDDYIQHKGDTNNYFGFGANDTFRVWTGGTQRVNIDNDSANFAQDVYAPKYYDSNAVTYYSEPGSTSILNNISIDDYVIHNGDTNTYVGFDATDQFGVWTNAAKRLNITNTAATFTNNVYAPRFYTNDYLTHNGDTNTYVGFDANDQFGVWTAGVKQIAVNTTKVDINLSTDITGALDVTGRSTLGNSLTRPDDLSDLSDSAVRIGGSDVHLHVASLAAAGDYAVALQSGRESDDASFPLALQLNGGNVGVGTTAAAATLTINKTTAQGNNPFATGTSLLSLGDVGTVDLSIRTDAAGNIYYINDNGGDQIWYDNGASGKFAILGSGVVAGSDSFINATPSVTTNFITTPAGNAFHSAGGISIEGKSSLLSIYQADGGDAAVNEATFLGVNELGFSAGGGFYMDDTATVKVRGNKDVFTTGNLYAGRFYDGNDNNYYADPASTSIMNRIDLDDYVRHNGDTNTYFGFAAADTFRIFTGGSQQVNIDNDSANFSQWMYGPRLIDSADNDYLVIPSGTSVLATIELDDYIQHKGNTDAYFGFSSNNTYKIFTNGVQRVNVDANSVDFAQNVYAPRYYDSNDNTYFLDPAAVSVMNNASFGQAASAGVKGRFLSIEGSADASGEGSGRIFFAEHNSSVAGQDRYGMSIAYQGGSATINSVTGQPVTLNGTSNGTWALIGHDNSVNGLWAMRGPRSAGYVEARGSFRAPLFYDSNNTAYYTDPASTSVMNVVRANQFQVDGSTYTIDSPSGDYGSIKVDGAKGGWAGYVIRDDWAFMSNGTSQAGLYNDTRNEWALLATDNSSTVLYSNGVAQLGAYNGYAAAVTSMRSPVYYPAAGTTRFLDLDSANGSESLKIGGEIFREGFAGGDGSDNKFLTAQDANQWIWNTASNWGIAWATNTSSAYRHVPYGDNMITFVGAGTVRAAIDLDSGNAFFQNEVSAGNFALSAGGENISLNPQYGSGLADTNLFDGTNYWEKRNTAPLQGNEANNIQTAEYVKNGNGPFASSYVVRTNGYRIFYSDMISVEPGEEVYGEIWTRVISGSGGRTYYGIERYDKDKKPIAGNTGTTYFVAGGQVTTSTSWQKFSSYTTIPTTHTPYNGSDGAGVKYIRIRILMNHSTGGALREYGPPILKRVDVQSKLYTQESLYVGTNATIVGDLTVDDITADIVDASTFRDKTNTARYMDPVSGGSVAGTWNFNNGNINNVNAMTFNDPGPNEGITWNGGSGWKIYESPDNLTTNSGGNLQIVQGTTSRARFNTSGDIIAGRYMDATRFRDSNNVGYFLDPASTSNLNSVTINGQSSMSTQKAWVASNYGHGIYGVYSASRYQHVWSMGTSYNLPANGSDTSGAAGNLYGLAWSYNPGYGGASNNIQSKSGLGHQLLLMMNGTTYFAAGSGMWTSGIGTSTNSFRAPIFYDTNNTGYYGDFASTSRMNVINANMYSMNDGWDIYDDSATTMSIRSNNSDNGTIIFRDSNSTDCGRIYFDDDSHWGFKTPDNEWSIYMERNARTILYYNGGQQARTQSGYFEANNQLRTPIMYDSNNTAYRIDGNGTSRLLTLNVDNVIGGSVNGYSGSLSSRDNRSIEPNDDSASQMKFGFTSWANNNTAPWADYLHMRSYGDSSGGSDNLVTFKKSGIGMRIWQQSFNSGTAYSTYRNVTIYNENPGGGNDLYASIFYDSNDTTYRIDPSSNSKIKHLKVAASTALARYDYAALEVRELNHAGAQGANPQTAPRIGFHWGGRVASQIMLETNGEIQIRNNPGTGYENMRAQIGYFQGDVRAPLFYDSNNTGYYTNPASTSVMSTLDVRGEIYNDGWFRSDSGGRGMYSTPYAQHWMATSNTQWNLYTTGNTQEIRFSTSGNNPRGHVYANNSNQIGFLDQSRGWNLRTTSSAVESLRNFYAPIMYDSNSTGYYVDPASTSVTNEMRANNFVHRGEVSDSSQFGLYMSQGKSTAYAIYKEGGSWSYPYPDLRIAMHTGIKLGANASYNGMRFYNDYNMAGQVMSINNASDPLGGNNVYVNNNLQAGSSLRAPIFYDSNNTAYYGNFASTNSSRWEGVNNRTMAMQAMPGHTRNSGEYYRARPRITSNTDYWTGSMGWGRQDMNVVATWGSGFIDSWSNPGSQPSGTSHWVGMQASHYRNSNTSGYGWQMVGGPIENLRFRSSWAGWRSWRTIPVLGVNSNNNAAMYANIYYDSDNTGYYMDPTAFTNLNTGVRATEVYARSWFRNDGARQGMYNQSTGAHSYSYQGQYWAITGNNNSSSMSLQLRATYNGTMCRWMYGDRTWSGDLNAAGQWQLQTRHTDGYSPTLRFIESGNESWTGNIGNDAGKIEYHSNRFYIEAGGNSTRICQFRRNGSDRSYVDNNGLYVGTATSARWADLAERYTADAIYENATVLGVNLDGDSEATLWQPGMPLLGVISTNPAVQMNDMGIEPGSTSKKAKMNPFIALKGRIPCLVNGDVKKGQWVIPDADGKAKGVDYGTPGVNSYEIIGIALSDSENGEVEVKV